MIKYKFPINKKNCSPCNKNSDSKISCYSNKSLNIMADKISNSENKKNISNLSKRKKWDYIEKYFHNKCEKKEACWKNQSIIKELRNKNIEKYTFKPDLPATWKNDKNTWLNTYDIYNVMKQYETKNKYFMKFGLWSHSVANVV